MKNRIRRGMYLVVFLSLILSYILMTFMIYRQTLANVKTELKQEAGYIAISLDLNGESYLQRVNEVHSETRITHISSDGKVLYDSEKDVTTLENHKSRKEVQEAFQNGSGEQIRKSNTLDEEMIYYALRLEDGSVLRVSRGMNSVLRTALSAFPQMLIIALVLLGFAWGLAHLEVQRLMQPVYKLDLEHPMENTVDEELVPLLERLDTQNQEKAKVEQMRKEFSANVSHELKTPLTSISGYAEIMKEGLVKPEDMKKFSERIYQEASRMITLVSDIIQISKLDEGLPGMEKETVDLYALSKKIIIRLSPVAEKKQVQMELVGEPVSIEGVPQVLEEMISNLCENAIKYNVEYGKVSVWTGKTLQGIKVIVTDTGIGIPKEHQERIFERFYRVDKSHSRETGGTGLGLSIVKHGAMLHNAEISVHSEVGRGTRMELTFQEDTDIINLSDKGRR